MEFEGIIKFDIKNLNIIKNVILFEQKIHR